MIVKICLKASSNKNTPFSELMQELLQYCFTSCICCIMANMGFGGFCVLKFLCFHLIFKKHNHTFLLFYFNMLMKLLNYVWIVTLYAKRVIYQNLSVLVVEADSHLILQVIIKSGMALLEPETVSSAEVLNGKSKTLP